MQPSTRSTYSISRRFCTVAAAGLLALSPLSALPVRAQLQSLPGLGQNGTTGGALGGLSGGFVS